MKIKSIKKAKDLRGKRILLRADFNVPFKDGKILDEYKIIRTLPTIRYLFTKNCKIILLTHLESSSSKKLLSVEFISRRLSEILGSKIKFVNEVVGFRAGTAVSRMKNNEIVMLENVRFEKGEKENDKKFVHELSKLADIYVNDSFGVDHRNHASLSAIKNYLPSYAGLLVESEINNLNKIFNPRKPFIAIIGGAKINTKIRLLEKLAKRADYILIGGALANNFFSAHKLQIGKSFIDKESIDFAKKFINRKVILPIDAVVSNKKESGEAKAKDIKNVKENEYIYDIGPKTIRLFASFIRSANTLIWNGPMGKFEEEKFKHGTLSIARLVANRSTGKAFGVAGGGETIEALNMTKMMDYVDWVSTGGGAMLAYLGGEKMPGLEGIVK